MESYSVSVALFDFLPVLVAAIGLGCLARGIGRRHRALAPVAWAAAAAITLGGLCKASWKLIIAVHDQRVDWLDHLLFILLAPGFVAMAFSLIHARSAWQDRLAADTAGFPALPLLLWLALPLAGALALGISHPGTRLWFFWLLAVTTFANWTLLVQAIIAARRSALPGWVSIGFAYNIVATLALAGLARLPPGETSAWIQEGVNLTAQSALALGFWRLGRRMQEQP
jgi:hypothetical protein